MDQSAAPPAWCEQHNARLRVMRVTDDEVEYLCPPGEERFIDRVERVHVIEERWMRTREEVTMNSQGENKAEQPKPSDTTEPGASQGPTSDGAPLTGNEGAEPKPAPETKGD